MKEVTKTYTITFSSETLSHRFERLLALFHFNSSFGHSGKFGMPLDGDGSEKIEVHELKSKSKKGSLPHEVNLITGAAYSVDLALDNSYSGFYRDTERECDYKTGPAGNLYKNGEVRGHTPSRDWEYDKRQERLRKGSNGTPPAKEVASSDRCAPVANKAELGPPPTTDNEIVRREP